MQTNGEPKGRGTDHKQTNGEHSGRGTNQTNQWGSQGEGNRSNKPMVPQILGDFQSRGQVLCGIDSSERGETENIPEQGIGLREDGQLGGRV